MATPQGYQCEFIDQVFDDLYCKKCMLVARRLTITTCCAESFCQDCIAGTIDQCPACGEEDYSAFQHVKNQRRIKCLQIYCNMKERGCNWSGTLEQLDSHLDSNCQYVDTKCPLNCLQTIPKNKMEQHVAEECVKRDYFCKHCSFKASYEVVMGTHWLECKYVPLQCPNCCGVTCERDFMEDHMKICRLEQIACSFSGVGCDGQFRREDQEEHARKNSQNHLALTASLALGMKEQLLRKILEQNMTLKEEVLKMEVKLEEQLEKLQDQDKIHEEEEQKLKQKLEEQEKRLQHQDELNKQEENLKRRLEEQEKKVEEIERKVDEQMKTLQDQDNLHKEEEKRLEKRLDEQKRMLEEQFYSKLLELKGVVLDLKTKSSLNDHRLSQFSMLSLRNFEMNNFSAEKTKDKNDDWKSPAMYTHMCGYKFCIGVDANGFGSGHGKAIVIEVWVMPGEYDDILKWPAKAKFTVKLLNQQGGRNASGTSDERTWSQPRTITRECWICRDECNRFGFIEHSKLKNFLFNNTLYFSVSNIELK